MTTQTNGESLKRANYLASIWTDPTTKSCSFYCVMKRKIKAYSKECGVEFELRKSTLIPWVSEYLVWVFDQNLTIREEKALMSFENVSNHILQNKIPEYVRDLQQKRSEYTGEITFHGSFFVFNGKYPKRGGQV